jgi:hypothetical protein
VNEIHTSGNGFTILPLLEEKNFMKFRDISAYSVHQAQSCIWLYDKMKVYHQAPAFLPFKGVLGYLMDVHTNQFSNLVTDGMDLQHPGSSFYFDSLYDALGVEDPIYAPETVLWAHCISYFRGHLRYQELEVFQDGWEVLCRDALMNANLLFTVMVNYHASSALKGMNLMFKVIDAEEGIIAKIDERNGLKT